MRCRTPWAGKGAEIGLRIGKLLHDAHESEVGHSEFRICAWSLVGRLQRAPGTTTPCCA